MGIEEYIQESDKGIKIDWEKITHLEESRRGTETDTYGKILEMLEKKKVITHSASNNFFVLGCGMRLDMGHKKYYFTNFEDAKAYGKAKHKNATYDVRIAQVVSGIINK